MKKEGKKAKPSKAREAVNADDNKAATPSVPTAVQQKSLNIFRDALTTDVNDDTVLQEVKGHLYRRDFASAFGKDEYLRVYALRWSASRALGYAQIFQDIEGYVLESTLDGQPESASAIQVLCLGGGAGAEMVGLAGWLNAHSLDARKSGVEMASIQVKGHFVDIADWSTVIDKLHNGIVNPPTLSKYASAAAKEKNAAFVADERFEATFIRADVLNWDEARFSTLAQQTQLMTIMFTLNELYSTSVPKTQRFLTSLTSHLRPGALLLVVDSPGSYSTVSLNGTEKRYPMYWLLDHVLVGSSSKHDDGAKWEKLLSEESKWFRLPDGLDYAIELENMRYQIHLYRRRGVDDTQSGMNGGDAT